MPSYLFPSFGQYLDVLLPLWLRTCVRGVRKWVWSRIKVLQVEVPTTLTGFPFCQFLASDPFLSSIEASQFLASALFKGKQVNLMFISIAIAAHRFIAVSFWSIDCLAVLLLPDRSRPPLPL